MTDKVLPPYKPAILRDKKGDLTKRWYLEYWVHNEDSNKPIRKQPSIKSNTKWLDVELLKKSLNVPQILKHLGIPGHNSSQFAITIDGKSIVFKYDDQSWKSTNLRKRTIKGGPIELLMFFKDYSWIEAIEHLGALKGIQIDIESLIRENKLRIAEATEKIEDINLLLQAGYVHKSEIRTEQQLRKQKEDLPSQEVLENVSESYLQSLSVGSRPNYRSTIKLFNLYLEEQEITNIPISEIRQEHIYEFSDWLQTSRANSNKSRNTKISILSSLFQQLKQRGYIQTNPCEGINQLKTIKRKNFPFTPEHKKKVLEHLKENDEQLYHFCQFIYYLFVRIKEARLI